MAERADDAVDRQIAARVFLGRSKRARLDAFNAEMKPLYAAASKRLANRDPALSDPETYSSVCLVFMRHQNDMRVLRDMLIHLGRVLGHDKRTINIEDKRSYGEVLETLKHELLGGSIVDVEATVKEVTNGEVAEGRT